MDDQPPASLSTELGCQADKNYGVETRANRIFKSIYVYSKEDYVDYPVMSNEKTLNCGHAPMGKFFHCSSCREKKCPTCWMRIKDHAINQVMSRWIDDVDYFGWVNTCKVCPPENANKHCPEDCPGRINYYFSSTQGVMPEVAALVCDCAACCSMTAAFQMGQHVEAKLCTALRGYACKETRTRAYQQFDVHMCRECFQKDFYNIKPMEKRIGSQTYKIVIRASKHTWVATSTMTADPPHVYLHSLEGGLEWSKIEWACLHVARHRRCHGFGHKCEMLSTTIMCTEAIRRLDRHRCLQAICIPNEYWDYAVVDFSSPERIDEYPFLAEHMWRHNIRRSRLYNLAARYREVILDMRAVRSERFKLMIFEFSHDNPIVERMQQHCQHAGEFMHFDSLTLLEAERSCRSCISEWLTSRSHFLQIAPQKNGHLYS